jgi:hypothetical protein
MALSIDADHRVAARARDRCSQSRQQREIALTEEGEREAKKHFQAAAEQDRSRPCCSSKPYLRLISFPDFVPVLG